MFLVGIFFLFSFFLNGWATTYYVNATNGNDYNNGLSPATPWKTIAKVKNSQFLPGDNILFKRGEIWREQLTVPSSGAPGNPLTFEAYGNGNKPIISGADEVKGWTKYKNNIWKVNLITEPNLLYFNETRGRKESSISNLNLPDEWFWANNNLFVYSTQDPDTAFINPGINIAQRTNCITMYAKSYITIDGLELQYSNGTFMDGGSGIEASYGFFSNIEIINCTIHDHNWDGIWIEGSDGNEITDVLIKDNIVYNCSLNEIASGAIHTQYVDNSLFENNFVYSNSEHGFRLWDSDNNIIQNNTCYFNGSSGITTPGHDETSYGNIIRYNVCHDNSIIDAGKANIELVNTKACSVYYNITYNSMTRGIRASNAFGDFVLNNVIYNSETDGLYAAGNSQNLTIKNNIIIKSGDKHIEFDIGSTSGSSIDYNIYGDDHAKRFEWSGNAYNFLDWNAYSGHDAHSIITDQIFNNAVNYDFSLKINSLAIDAGTDLGFLHDFIGTKVFQGQGVDIGAFEYKLISPPKNFHLNH